MIKETVIHTYFLAAKESEEGIKVNVVIKVQHGDLCSDGIGVYLTIVVDTTKLHIIKLNGAKFIDTHKSEYK